jgi:hypothetical protein
MALERGIVGKVVEDIEAWIKSITKAQDNLGGFPVCPYASKAIYCIKECTLSDVGPVEGVDVAIFVVGNVALSQLLQRVDELNMIYHDYIFLDDHISEPSYINGIQTNCGKHNLILVQKRNSLLEARDQLKKTEYYKFWSEEMYNRIVKG